jgi:hypothetical protein
VNLRSVVSAKLALTKTGALKIPNDGVKTAATAAAETAATPTKPISICLIFIFSLLGFFI